MQSTTQNDLRNSLSDRINADLMLSGRHHHQRDLFTGSLGIPDVTTHVGSVIHAFETLARDRTATDFVSSGEQPYELTVTSSGGGKKTLFKKSDGSKLPTSKHSAEHRQRYVIPTPPPPPLMSRPSSPSVSEVAAIMAAKTSTFASDNMGKSTIQYQYHTHTLPHAYANNSSSDHTGVRQHMPTTGTQTMRIVDSISGVNRMGGRSDADGSVGVGEIAANRNGRTFGDGSKRHIGASNSSGNVANNTGYIQKGEHFFSPENENESSNLDSINMDDYHKKLLFGSHPTIESKVFHSAKPITNYDDINFRDFERKQKPIQSINSDTNNNAHKLRERSNNKRTTDIYLVQTDNVNGNYPYLKHSSHNNNSNNNNNNNINNSNNANNTKNNYDNNQTTNINNPMENHWNLNEDDQTFLRGSTVSQSFIKNIKNTTSPRKLSENYTSTSNGFKRIAEPPTILVSKRSSASASRSYYKPQKYVLNDEAQDELRARYTEHSENCNITLAKKSQPKSFKPAKHSGFNYTRQK